MDSFSDISLRTPVPLLPRQGTLSHSTPILTLGSCFSDNIGRRLQTDLFDVSANPFGPLFNPLSVADALERILDGSYFTRADLERNGSGEWFCFDLYTGFTSVDPDKVVYRANLALDEARRILFSESAPLLLITFGTAFAFTLNGQAGRVVANCHKQLSDRFRRFRLDVDAITGRWFPLLQRVIGSLPGIKIIFTISPVRHLADGAHENTLSKSILGLAIERLTRDTGFYYPAYEILLDELRDYRFYAADMAHPSDVASDYIYSHFIRSLCTTEEISLTKKCRNISQRFTHRPISDNAEAYAGFIEKSVEYGRRLAEQYPSIRHSMDCLLASVTTCSSQ